MGQYVSGMSFSKQCALEKEKIIMALNGKVQVGEDDVGVLWGNASAQECQNVVVSAFDNVVYQALTSMHTGRAVENLLKKELEEQGRQFSMMDYIRALEETKIKNEYTFDTED